MRTCAQKAPQRYNFFLRYTIVYCFFYRKAHKSVLQSVARKQNRQVFIYVAIGSIVGDRIGVFC